MKKSILKKLNEVLDELEKLQSVLALSGGEILRQRARKLELMGIGLASRLNGVDEITGFERRLATIYFEEVMKLSEEAGKFAEKL